MRIDMWTLGLQAINLIVLVWILSRYLFKPIGAILAQRQAQARTILDDAEAERSQAAAALRLARDEEQSLAANRDARLRQAQTEAETSASAILEQARAEAAHIVALARALGRRPDIEVGVDPDLIAGFELQTAHVRVVNSLREDLHRIQKELTAHERS